MIKIHAIQHYRRLVKFFWQYSFHETIKILTKYIYRNTSSHLYQILQFFYREKDLLIYQRDYFL